MGEGVACRLTLAYSPTQQILMALYVAKLKYYLESEGALLNNNALI